MKPLCNMGDDMKQFIRTSYEDTYKNLLKCGCTFLGKEGNFWVFLNNGKTTFSEDEKKVVFSNKYNI